ncbi:MAG TPA: EamA family transporter [Candidatus Thermoplasmatota archaeon]|nr:EamA family transporter [Candidatus Thermoplasmatota archaeon]
MAFPLRPRDLSLLLLLGAIWGTAFVFITVGLQSFSPILLAALRFDIVALVLFGIAAARRKGPLLPQNARQWTAIAIAGVFNIAAYHAFLFWGQLSTSAAIAAVIVGLNPVLTTVASRWFLEDERVGTAGLVGLALGFGGVVLLASMKPGSLLDAQGIGELLCLGAIGAWALGSVLVKRTKHGMDVFTFIAWHCLAGSVVLHAASFLFEDGGRATFDLWGVTSLLYLALISSAIGFVIYYTLFERIGPIRVNLVSHVAALSATLSAPLLVLIPGLEWVPASFELRAILAFILIASGFALVARPAPGRPVPVAVAPESLPKVELKR